MRKWLRSVARFNMKQAGVERINRKFRMVWRRYAPKAVREE